MSSDGSRAAAGPRGRGGLLVGLATLALIVPLALAGLAAAVTSMNEQAEQAAVACVDDPTAVPAAAAGAAEGGVGFALPQLDGERRASLHNRPAGIPTRVRALYMDAASRYALPWTLLAGIGMAETVHGRVTATSSAGARGLMQFMPATFAAYGVDGDDDGRTVITSDADSVFSAANYLTASGVSNGPAGVRTALFAYNHATWYVNDVLHYAAAYGGGVVVGDATVCPAGAGDADVPPLSAGRLRAVLAFAARQVGEPYVYGATGPNAWDCSAFTGAAYAQIGVRLPRTARAQRAWLAAGNGHRVRLGQERPGDLVFWDSYRGPNQIGHVMLVWDPTRRRTVEARGRSYGVGYFSYANGPDHHIFEIWRVGNVKTSA